ncbi:protein AKNAD1 [Protobothrops mucrosquamatus]|uniref:protein AKNAD1 n=1 Tax=Protobothrops mucrosquamatus TaxID=103944 RepID=UPI000775CCC7|nr:protein AKNAD1 [Protobothrops mucrosquamatus]
MFQMLTRQAEVQNHIDHLRFSPKIPPCSNSHTAELSVQAQSTGIASKMPAFSPVTIPMDHMLDFSQSPHSANPVRKPSVNTPFLQNVTDDKEQILKKQTEELKANVEIFSECIKQNVFSVEEHLQFLQLLKEQLEQLEHYYVATKEKHYALQRQNHKHSSRNIGEFDPNRKVEGEIFKLGMLLEGIKEKIEKTFTSYSSTYITSPSLRSHPSSVCSSHSASPLIISTNESPKRNVAGLNISQNENYWKNKNHLVEVVPQKAHKKSIQGDSNHPFQQMNLNDLQIRSSALANFMSKESNEVDCTLLNEQGRSASDNFLEKEDKHKIIIHPTLKMQLSRNQICSCSSNRTKTTEYRKGTRGHSDCERFPIFSEEKPVDLDVTGSLQKNSIAQQRICKEEQREDFIDRLCDRQNLYIPQTRYSKMHDTIVLSPQYLSGSNINGRKSVSNRRKSKDINSMILNCTLDNAIQMANNLKTTTEHMMQAVSEDLANVKIQTLSSGIAHQY